MFYCVAFFLIIVLISDANDSSRQIAAARIQNLRDLPNCSFSGHPGHLTLPEMIIRNSTLNNPKCGHREPTTLDREKYWVELRTGEMSPAEVYDSMSADCEGLSDSFSLGPWNKRMPGRVYAWSADFHPAPGSCSFPIYKDIGVTLRLECDTKPNCEAAGVCRKRMKSVFGLGAQAMGYALDPEPKETIANFYKAYKDDPEMNRVDVFVCSHPAANCELFEPFITAPNSTKAMVMYPTTRLEFGRCDPFVKWRIREIKTMNSYGELPERWRRTVEFILRYNSANNKTGRKRLWLAANNMYDAAYVQYFTGIRPVYIPSWCGDEDQSFGYRKNWVGCSLWNYDNTTIHKPTSDVALFVPHRNIQWSGQGAGKGDPDHPLYKEFHKAQVAFRQQMGRQPPKIHHSHDVISNHAPHVYKKYKAVVWMPYQSSLMSFFELYRLNIPMFAPTKDLLKSWHWEVDMMSDRVYGVPDAMTDLTEPYVRKHGGMNATDVNERVPNPNWQHEERGLNYWFSYSDLYMFDHITYFSNFTELLHQMDTVDLAQVSRNMAEYNSLQRQSIMLKWDDIFREAAPHVDRSDIVAEYGIDEARIRAWAREQEEENERVVMRLQGEANYCKKFPKYGCTGSLATINSAYVKRES